MKVRTKVGSEKNTVASSNLHNSSAPLVWSAEDYTDTVYCLPGLTRQIACQLYAAGFDDVDEPDPRGFTPLMRIEIKWFGGSRIDRFLDLATWFIDHGADLHCGIGNTKTSASHRVAWMMARSFIDDLDFSIPATEDRGRSVALLQDLSRDATQLLKHIITDSCRDGCSCRCSTNGCRPLTWFLKNLVPARNPFTTRPMSWRQNRKILLLFVLGTLIPSQGPELQQFTEDIVRFLTFSNLDITHTCCLRSRCGRPYGQDVLQPMPSTEAAEIFDEEQDLHAILESVVEQSAKALEDSDLSLLEFLEAYWPSLMDAAQDHTLTPENLQAIGELGVKLIKE